MLRKKLTLLIAVLFSALICAFGLAACNQPDTGEKNVTVYIGDKTLEVTTEQAYLHGLLKELYADGRISAYVYSGDENSAFASQVDAVVQGVNGPYISVWHSLDEFALKSVYNSQFAEYNPSRSEVIEEDGTRFIAYTHNGVTLYLSGAGLSQLPLRDGGVYAVFLD